MDTVTTVRQFLALWSSGGSAECRNALFAAHCDTSSPESLHILATAYHTLLSAVFSVWAPEHPLTIEAFVQFLREVLDALPSTSNQAPIPATGSIFGDHLVDIIWTIDAQLDEFLNDARTQIAAVTEQEGPASPKTTAFLAKAKADKANAESDKERVHALVKALVESGIISVTSCRERLDSSVLASVGLIPDKAMLDKKEIRTRTGIFYKQNKFNLLREQSEGYSKLITEVTSGMGPAHSSQTGLPTEPVSVIESRARPVWEKVISLIGHFDLDPNRALDVILDVFSVHLATHYSFFLTLLSFSPWASPYRRGQEEQEDMKIDTKPVSYTGKVLDEILTMNEKHQPPSDDKPYGGSRVLAQVLGFKFVHYQTLATETTPRSLFLMSALLVKEGFLALEDIYPHLSPNDEDMEGERKEYLANVQSRISGAKMSALAMAGPLESSASQSKAKSAAPPETKKSEVKETNQKVGLLVALLTLGEIRPGIAILSKFPWLVDTHPEIADLLIRVMKLSIGSLYDSLLGKKENGASFSQPRARYGPSGVVRASARKPLLTTWAPTPPSTNSTDFVFFFPTWNDQVPIVSTLADLEWVIEPFLRFAGPHLSRDPLFLCMFLRLGRHHLVSTYETEPSSEKLIIDYSLDNPIRVFWLKVVRLYMLPTLPLIRGNTICTVEVWNIVRLYDLANRWQLYGEWKNSVYKSHPELRVRQVQTDKESKDILRRLSHNTIDSLSGAVGKLAHNNPCIFFAHAVNQVMAYDNLAAVVVQALKFVTIMGFDVLVFIILDAFSNPDKARVKDDGVNISDWLQSLASFTGMLFRRYSTDLTPVLNYVVHQLLNDKTSEIVVLRELIWKMAGIEPLPTLSDAQITAMAGGPTLRIQAIASGTRGARLDPSEVSLKGPQRLSRALLDSKLALPLLVQVAQQRQSCVFKAPEAPLKSLASLFDTTHGVLLQYLELLTLPPEDSVVPGEVKDPRYLLEKVLPPLEDLGDKYGIAAPICMQIIRPVLQRTLLVKALALQAQERVAGEEAEKRLKAALTAKREPGLSVSRVASPALGSSGEVTKPANGQEITPEETAMEVDASPPAPESPWLPELAELFDAVKKIAPGNAYEVIGPGFYLTFWQMSTYDLSPPSARYNEEGAALRALSHEEDTRYNLLDRSSDRAKRNIATSHRNRRDRFNTHVAKLSDEFKAQTTSRAFTLKRLAREKPFWFAHSTKSAHLINSLIEHCIHPRALLSPMDADFCAQFIKVLHLQGTPGFHTLMCYDKLLGEHVKVVLFSCTEYEARNYGRFLLGILTDLHKWHTDEATYAQENKTKSGGKYVPLPGLQRQLSKGPTTSETTILSWSNFQQVLRKWHRKLAKCITDSIQTGEFMHVYNSIIVLKEIISVFPLADVMNVGAEIDTVMDKLIETEDRGDLKILARAYSAGLKKRESLWTASKPALKSNGAVPTISSANSPAPEKPRVNGPASLQASSSEEIRRPASQQPPTSAPSGPRAQLSQSGPQHSQSSDPMHSTKLAMESIPRPEVVKRVRPDAKIAETSRPPPEAIKTDVSQPIRPIPVHISGETRDNNPLSRPPSMYPPRPSQVGSPVPVLPTRDLNESRRNEDRNGRMEGAPEMPPPSIPSQTLSAQELRETARQSIQQHRPDKLDARSQNISATLSPRIRSMSPATNSRPGTRETSAESRDSGRVRSERRERSERGNGEPGSEERGRKELSRQELRENASGGRRDSLTHTRERANRDRASGRGDGDRDRDSERGRDRHGDREREKDRGGERDRDRERERDRDRDRDRDRHRRDDKDRERDGSNRKERDSAVSRGAGTPSAPTKEGLPSRPELSRHRPSGQNVDDGLGKRRRATDDDSDRASKRSSRKESHRDSDRGRRLGQEKDDRNHGESDRRRKEREQENEAREGRGSGPEKVPEKRQPPGITTGNADLASGLSQADSPSNSKTLSGYPPVAPRAMVGKNDNIWDEREKDRERERSERERERDPRSGSGSARKPAPAAQPASVPTGTFSLRSRISDKEQPPPPTGPTHLFRALERAKEEDRETRKRTASEREKDADPPAAEPSTQPPKRPKINRHRYTGGGSGANLARKLLPIDPHAGDKNPRRHDG